MEESILIYKNSSIIIIQRDQSLCWHVKFAVGKLIDRRVTFILWMCFEKDLMSSLTLNLKAWGIFLLVFLRIFKFHSTSYIDTSFVRLSGYISLVRRYILESQMFGLNTEFVEAIFSV